MAMQNYTPMRLAPNLDAGLRNDLLKVDRFLRQLTPFTARVPSAPQGTPPASGSFDLLNFLYLPGRVPSQDAFGRVTFETKIISGDTGAATPNTDRFGFRVTSPQDGPIDVNILIEEAQTSPSARPKSPVREWVFPAFNRLDEGPKSNPHYFVDQGDYQPISNKLLDSANYYGVEDTNNQGGFYNAAWNKHLGIAWGGSFPAGGFNSAAGTVTTSTGTQPSLQIPSLDYKVQGNASTFDRSHIWCVMKKDHTAAPFEPNSFLYGGASGKELYHMLATAAGTIAAASNGYIPYFNNTLALTVTFNLGSALVNLDAGNTTGMRVGMRVRQTSNTYSLPEDVYVQQVNSSTSFTMTQNWPGSTLSGQTIQVFGPTWENVSAISGSITDVVDNIFNIVDNGDTTKKLAFEVSGVTTATTRTWTVPNFDGTPALFRSGKLRIGDTTAPTHNLEIIAGTTTVAPIRLTSGTSLTAAAAGAIEFTTNDLFFTITTGTARKRLLMADPTGGLTATRVPFATTNGRLTDDSAFTYNAGLLSLGSINASGSVTATGNVQGFNVVGTNFVQVDSFVTMSSAGVGIGSLVTPSYPLDIHTSDSPNPVFILGTNVTETATGAGITMAFIDDNSGVQSGERLGLDIQLDVMHNAAATSSLSTVAGMRFNNVSSISDAVAVGESFGITTANSTLINTGGGSATIYGTYGIRSLVNVQGTSITGTEVVGFDLLVGASGIAVTDVKGIHIRNTGSYLSATNAVALDVNTGFGASANVTNWYGLRIPSISGPGTIWGIYQSGTMNSAIAGKLALGSTTAPAHWLDIAAGTTAVAPVRLASGTNLTSPTAGCVEYDGSYFYATHGDTVRTAVVTRRAVVNATVQAAAIGSTTLYSPPAAGYYVVHYTLETTTADAAAGTIQIQVGYTDDIGATNQTGAALVLTATGRDRGSFQVYSASGTITYQTNLTGIIGTSRYALRVRLEALG